MRTKLSLIVILFVVALSLSACEPEQVIVEVTRVITEVITEEGEVIEVTRVVTEVEEIEVPITVTTDLRLATPLEVTRIVEVEVTSVVTATPGPEDSATGTAETTGTPEATIETQAAAGPLFLDTFDTGISPEWSIEDKAAWASVNGQLTSLSGNSLMAIGDPNWTNYAVSTDVVSVTDNLNTMCALLIQSDEDDNATIDRMLPLMFGHEKWADHDWGYGLFWAKPDGELDRPDEIPGAWLGSFTPPYNLQVSIKSDGTIITLVDGEQAANIVMPDFGVGRPAIWCNNEGVVLDNFSVTALEE
jgi:hypothetical protein